MIGIHNLSTSLGQIDYSCSSATNPVFCVPFTAVFVCVFLKLKILFFTDHYVTCVFSPTLNKRNDIGKRSKKLLQSDGNTAK